ncbi:MAG: hypothetical protein MJA83_01425, partial [Gammaproteobacteria bacterium]|nr:hypothetical protein [Gammaproteobacteria bacterium]
PTSFEAFEYVTERRPQLQDLFVYRKTGAEPQPLLNMLFTHGVASCLEYAKSEDRTKAEALKNNELAPHLSFMDTSSHGYAVAEIHTDEMFVEYVAMDKPLSNDAGADGPQVKYRINHRVESWSSATPPSPTVVSCAGETPLGSRGDTPSNIAKKMKEDL